MNEKSEISNQTLGEVVPVQSWWMRMLRDWWMPTTQEMLRKAERKMRGGFGGPVTARSVSIGPSPFMPQCQVWTLSANTESKNTPLLLLHSFGSGSALWATNLCALAEDRPVYAIDILGFGRSSRVEFPSDAVTAEKMFVESVELWRQAVGLERFIPVGHGFGGFLAASYSIKCPERVPHLVLVDPWGFSERPLDVDEHSAIPIWAKVLGTFASYFHPMAIVRLAGPMGPWVVAKLRPDLTNKFQPQIASADVADYLYHCNCQVPSGEAAFHRLMQGFGWAKYPMVGRLEALRRETDITLIHGSRSWLDRDPGFRIKYSRPESFVDVQVIQGAGHHVYADRAANFNQVLAKLSARVDNCIEGFKGALN